MAKHYSPEEQEENRLKDLEILKQKACYPVLPVRGYLKGRNKLRFVQDCEQYELRVTQMLTTIITYYYDRNPPKNPTK